MGSTEQAPTQTPPSSTQSTLQESSKQKERIYFLDNIKLFLTFIVITHHTICAFGGCKQNSNWYLTIGNYRNPFSEYCGMITTVDQAYIAPLFLLISGYFTPSSYTK